MITGKAKAIVSFLILLYGWASVASAVDAPYCVSDLTRMSWPELEAIYRQAEPGRVPCGFAKGRVVYCQDAFMARAKSGMAQVFWKGKHFCATDGMLINQWLGVKAIQGAVADGTSWLDGKPAIILDYSGTSRVWSDVRDEMREISPGVYLGAMYLRRCPEPQLKLYFILQTCD